MKKKRFILVLGITLILLLSAYGVTKIYAYNSESFTYAQNYLESQEKVLSYFNHDLDIKYSICEFDIRHSKTVGNASYVLLLKNSSKTIKVHIQMSKKLKWMVTSVEYEELIEPAPTFSLFI